MRVFVTKWFDRWARGQRLADRRLCGAVDEIERGLLDANLGHGLLKKRVAGAGRGKRGSYRTLLAFKPEQVAVFIYGFAKNERDDIRSDEKRALMALAGEFLEYDRRQLDRAAEKGALRELRCGNEQE